MLGFHGDASPHLHLSLLTLYSSNFAVARPPWSLFCDQGHSAASVPSGHPWKAVGEQHTPCALPLRNGDAARALWCVEIPIMMHRAPQAMLWQKPMGTCFT